MKNHTHFVLVYSVPCYSFSNGKKQLRKDYCVTEPRAMKHLEPLTKCDPETNVTVFKIEWKGGNV